MVLTLLFTLENDLKTKHYLEQSTAEDLARKVWLIIEDNWGKRSKDYPYQQPKIYGVPRGGVSAAYLVKNASFIGCSVTLNVDEADYIIDDIIDSGATKKRYAETNPDKLFLALIDKTDEFCEYLGEWVVFPWERAEDADAPTETIEDNVTRILQYIGEDVKRGGLLDTPKRVAKAWGEWCSGYKEDVKQHFKTFEDGSEGCDEMVIIKNIPFYSHCEHHMAPFFGTVTIGYIPNGRVLGLSKFSRIVGVFAKRLQVQERLTTQIAECLMEGLNARGVGVVINARHMCMESRGVCQQGSETQSQKLLGIFKEKADTKAEFLRVAS
jgi:GTP cyclohydrolase IA